MISSGQRYQMWHNAIYFYAIAKVIEPDLYISGFASGLPMWCVWRCFTAGVSTAFRAPADIYLLILRYTFTLEDRELVVASPGRYGDHWGLRYHRLCCPQLTSRNRATFYRVPRVITTLYSQRGGPVECGECCRDRAFRVEYASMRIQ